jgi:hypothetical protein
MMRSGANSVPSSRKTQLVFITKVNYLMLFREIISAYFYNHKRIIIIIIIIIILLFYYPSQNQKLIYQSLVQSILLYGAETWSLNTQQANKLLATEMDFWRRSARKSRKE